MLKIILFLLLLVISSGFAFSDSFADHDQFIKIIEPNGISDICSPSNTDCTSFPIAVGEQIVFDLHSIGVYNPLDTIKVWIDKDGFNQNTEVFVEFGNAGGTSSPVTVVKNGEGNYQIVIDTTNIADGTHNVKIDGIQTRNGPTRTLSGEYVVTIGSTPQNPFTAVSSINENGNTPYCIGYENIPPGTNSVWSSLGDAQNNLSPSTISMPQASCSSDPYVGDIFFTATTDTNPPNNSNTIAVTPIITLNQIPTSPQDGDFVLPCSMQEAGDGVSSSSCYGFYTNEIARAEVGINYHSGLFPIVNYNAVGYFLDNNGNQGQNITVTLDKISPGESKTLVFTNPASGFVSEFKMQMLGGTLQTETPDTIPPVVVVPNNKAIEATSNNPSPVTFLVSATDDADGTLTPSCSHNSGNNFPIGLTTVTCTATDAAGNSDSKSFTITVTYDDSEPLPETDSSETKIDARATKSSYENGDTVLIIGSITNYDSSSGKGLTYIIISPDNNITNIGQIYPDSDGSFTKSFDAGGALWKLTGEYIVKFQYGAEKSEVSINYLGGEAVISEPVPEQDFEIDFETSGMKVLKIEEDNDFISLLFSVDVTSSRGILEVVFDRDYFDSTFNGVDDEFIILADGNEPDFSETQTTSQSRTLRIELKEGTEEVEIIGSKLNGNISNDFPFYGDNYEEELEIISLSTKKSQYLTGDTIVITGKVNTSDFSRDVVLQVFTKGIIVDISQVSVSLNESFSHTVIAEGPLWEKSGMYTVKATYGDDSEDTSFSYRYDGSTTDSKCGAGTFYDPESNACVLGENPKPYPETEYEVTIETAQGSGAPGCEDTSQGCYIPSTVSVAVGGKVIMKNTDTAAHTFTSGDPTMPDTVQVLFDSGLAMAGSTFEWSPTEEGVVDYFCMVHPWMQGIILVGEGTAPPHPEPPSDDHIDLDISIEGNTFDINTSVGLSVALSGNTKTQTVAIDVTDPKGTTVISRSVEVESNNNTYFEFKIDENFKPGNYKLTATTSDGNRTEKDVAHFKVKSQFNSFKITSVQVTDQKGNPSDLEAGDIGFIKVNLESSKSIATLMTVNIFDAELTSIGIGSVNTTLSSGGSEIILSFNIPDDAALGPADIYVNAFSDWPSEGGVPLTVEVSAVEDIQ